MIYLARHGHTHNPERLLYGNRPGFRLSRVGRWQAAQLGRRLASVRLAAVYSSPNDRAVETAWMATGRPPLMVPAFLDWEPDPEWVGRSWDDIPRLDPERWSEFRVKPWIDARPAAAVLRQLAAFHVGDQVLVVGHQDPIRAVLNLLLPEPGARLRDDPLPQCALRVVDPRTWRVVEKWEPPAASSWPAGAL